MGVAQEAAGHDWREVPGAFGLGKKRQDVWNVLIQTLLQDPVKAGGPPRDGGDEDGSAIADDAAGFAKT